MKNNFVFIKKQTRPVETYISDVSNLPREGYECIKVAYARIDEYGVVLEVSDTPASGWVTVDDGVDVEVGDIVRLYDEVGTVVKLYHVV
jgi:hypothetical protein